MCCRVSTTTSVLWFPKQYAGRFEPLPRMNVASICPLGQGRDRNKRTVTDHWSGGWRSWKNQTGTLVLALSEQWFSSSTRCERSWHPCTETMNLHTHHLGVCCRALCCAILIKCSSVCLAATDHQLMLPPHVCL